MGIGVWSGTTLGPPHRPQLPKRRHHPTGQQSMHDINPKCNPWEPKRLSKIRRLDAFRKHSRGARRAPEGKMRQNSGGSEGPPRSARCPLAKGGAPPSPTPTLHPSLESIPHHYRNVYPLYLHHCQKAQSRSCSRRHSVPKDGLGVTTANASCHGQSGKYHS